MLPNSRSSPFVNAPSALFSVYYQNVRGLRTKLKDLYCSILSENYLAICLSETWLNTDIKDIEIADNRYVIYRTDRNPTNSTKSRGGGVLLAVNRGVHSYLAPIIHSDIEEVWIVIKQAGGTLLMCTVYIPPGADSLVYEKHMQNTEFLMNRYVNSQVLIFGDYNLPNIKWKKTEDLPGCFPTNIRTPSEEIICDNFSANGLYQFNVIPNSRGTMLDLCFSNVVDIDMPDDCVPLLNCDVYHPPLNVNLNFAKDDTLRMHTNYYYNFKHANYVLLNDYLEHINWDFINDYVDINNATDAFYKILYHAIDISVPQSLCKERKFPVWFSHELKSLIFEKKIAHREYKTSKDFNAYTRFSRLRKHCKTMVQLNYNNYIEGVENSIPNNIKTFWKYVNSVKGQNNIPNALIVNNSEITGGPDIAETFAHVFENVYTKRSINNHDIKHETHNIIEGVDITPDLVFDIISNLDINKGPGPDGIPPVVLKNCSHSLALPLFYLFSLSLATGNFPDVWKRAYVTPIFKSGNKSDPSNYRPITILSAIPKALEKIVTNFLSYQFKNIIIEEQQGFQAGKSTTINLATFVNFAQCFVEEGAEVHVVYTDFSKAFDKVNLDLLIVKLSKLGISGNLLKWLSSYLFNRHHQVKVNGYLSNAFIPSSGVPQGSHLGPLLFNLFINDIVTNFHFCKILLFADDLKIYTAIHSLRDCLKMQDDLDRFSYWTEQNDMHLNMNKCEFMRFSRKQESLENPPYMLKGLALIEVKQVEDLGVILDPKLNFNDHIDHLIAKANRLLGFITRSASKFKSIQAYRTLYVSLVRSSLEYCAIIWAPQYLNHINRIEQVQKKFIKYANYKLNRNGVILTNDEAASYLNLPSLEHRRKYYDICFVFKLINNVSISPYLLSQLNLNVPPRNTRAPLMFKPNFHRTSYGRNTPVNRMQINFNTYGNDVDIFNDSYSSFCRQARANLY